MFMKINHIALSAAIVTSTFFAQAGAANAMMVLPINTATEVQAAEILTVQNNDDGKPHIYLQWQVSRDGNRCRTRTGTCRYYYQGYYYQTRWWTLPLITGDQLSSQNNNKAHVRWCMSRYRSYNPRTDLWLSYNGMRYRCNSPY